MAWWELRLVGLSRASLDDVSSRLFALGTTGLQESLMPGQTEAVQQPWDEGPTPPPPDPLVLTAWFEDPDLPQLRAALSDVPAEATWRPVDEVDWEQRWRDSIQPITVTEHLTIAPPWNAPPGSLVLEPGSGFGSGTHPSTRMALVAVECLAPGLDTALDVGCGSGILAIAAARHGLDVEGIDVEQSAIIDARSNAALNGVAGQWSTTPLHRLDTQRDLVLGNLHAELIARLAPDLVRLTGTWLVLAGILADREALVREVLDPQLALRHREVDGEWIGLRYSRES